MMNQQENQKDAFQASGVHQSSLKQSSIQIPIAEAQYSSALGGGRLHDGLPRLHRYDTIPQFHLEKVAQTTHVPLMTLRAWERRYHLPAPERRTNNVALYSQQDIAAASWLRRAISSGMGVRQAMEELARLEPQYASKRGVNLSVVSMSSRSHPQDVQQLLLNFMITKDERSVNSLLEDAFATHTVSSVCQHLLSPVLVHIMKRRRRGELSVEVEGFVAAITRSQTLHFIEAGIAPNEAVRALSSLILQASQEGQGHQQEQGNERASDFRHSETALLDAIYHLNEANVQQVLDEAFRHHSVEEVCLNLLQAVLYHIGMLWAEKRISVTTEHFATNIIRARLFQLFQAASSPRQEALIFVGCAPKETHEVGALMLALFCRRAGFNVLYLGQMVEIQSLMQDIRTHRPILVCLSAMMRPRIKDLMKIAREIEKVNPPQPLFCFGGGAFGQNTDMIEQIKGIYLGSNAWSATQRIQELLHQQSVSSSQQQEGIRTRVL